MRRRRWTINGISGISKMLGRFELAAYDTDLRVLQTAGQTPRVRVVRKVAGGN
jgi:hypothetical protein